MKKNKESRISGDLEGFAACDWLNNKEFVACKDGDAWKISPGGH